MPQIEWPRVPTRLKAGPDKQRPRRVQINLGVPGPTAQWLKEFSVSESKRLGYPVAQGTVVDRALELLQEELRR